MIIKMFASIFVLLTLFSCDSEKKNNAVKYETPKIQKNNNPKLIRISTEEYAPFISKNLNHNGFLAQVVTEAFEIEGIKTQFEFLPAVRSLESAKTGEYDASIPWAKRKERLELFYFGEPVIESDTEAFFYLEGKDFEWDPQLQDYSLLKGKIIGAISSANYGEKFMNAEKSGIIKVDRVAYTHQNLMKLAAGRIDIMISPKIIALHDIKQSIEEEPDFKSIRSKTAIKEAVEYDYLIISKNAPNGALFNEAFNKGLKKLKSSGRYKELYEQFIQSLKN